MLDKGTPVLQTMESSVNIYSTFFFIFTFFFTLVIPSPSVRQGRATEQGHASVKFLEVAGWKLGFW